MRETQETRGDGTRNSLLWRASTLSLLTPLRSHGESVNVLVQVVAMCGRWCLSAPPASLATCTIIKINMRAARSRVLLLPSLLQDLLVALSFLFFLATLSFFAMVNALQVLLPLYIYPSGCSTDREVCAWKPLYDAIEAYPALQVSERLGGCAGFSPATVRPGYQSKQRPWYRWLASRTRLCRHDLRRRRVSQRQEHWVRNLRECDHISTNSALKLRPLDLG